MVLTEPYTISDIFYIHDIMPCCGKPVKYSKGPESTYSVVIKCSHCNQKWFIASVMHSIQKL